MGEADGQRFIAVLDRKDRDLGDTLLLTLTPHPIQGDDEEDSDGNNVDESMPDLDGEDENAGSNIQGAAEDVDGSISDLDGEDENAGGNNQGAATNGNADDDDDDESDESDNERVREATLYDVHRHVRVGKRQPTKNQPDRNRELVFTAEFGRAMRHLR